MRILPLLLPVALMLPATLTAQKINDVVLKKDGARVRGLEITDFLLSGVRGKRGADDFVLPAHMVKDIEWSELPEEFIAGKGGTNDSFVLNVNKFDAATLMKASKAENEAAIAAGIDLLMVQGDGGLKEKARVTQHADDCVK